MANIEEKFELWSKKLYDISKKNYMINFNGQKNRSLSLSSPNIFDLYNLLVVDEKTLSFKRTITRDSNVNVFAVSKLLEALGKELDFKEGDIDTYTFNNKSSYDVLRNIRRVSNEFKLEQGIDVMHITFGYIRWKPVGMNDYYKTPLINIPVTLEQEQLFSLYKVSKIGDPEVNPIFKYMLEQQGIELPKLDDKSLKEYFESIDKLANENGWDIIEEATLCILFFQKMVMFKDLQNNKHRIFNHPILKAFCDEMPIEETEDNLTFNHDLEDENDKILVVNADSSQMDALSLAKTGKSFVLQGPPGTGKSQTITNIIAQAVESGKKVLFVSQKTAALEVVYNKLKHANLDDFCLALHNHKLNKVKVINDLYKPYLLKKRKVKEEKLQSIGYLQKLKEEINEYNSEINKKVYQLDDSFYDIIDKYYDYVDEVEANFDFTNDITKVTSKELNQIVLDIEMFENHFADYQKQIGSCYEYCNITSLNLFEKETLEKKLTQSINSIGKVGQLLSTLESYIPNLNFSLETLKDVIFDLRKVVSSNYDNINLFEKNNIKNDVVTLNEIIKLSKINQSNKDQINSLFVDSIFNNDMKSLALNSKEYITKIVTSIEYFKNQSHYFVISNLNQYKNALESIISNYDKLINANDYLFNTLGLKKETLEKIDLYAIYEELSNNNYSLGYFDVAYKNYSVVNKNLIELKDLNEQINENKNLLSKYASLTILQIDINDAKVLLNILNDTENSFARFFQKDKRDSRKEALNKIGYHLKEKAPTDIIVKILNTLIHYHSIKIRYDEIKDSLKMLVNNAIDLDAYEIDFKKHIDELNKANRIMKLLNEVPLDNLKLSLSYSNKERLLETLSIILNEKSSVYHDITKYSLPIDLNEIKKQYDMICLANKNVSTLKLYCLNDDSLQEIENVYDAMINYQDNIDKYNSLVNILNISYNLSTFNLEELKSQLDDINDLYDVCNKYHISEDSLLNAISNNLSDVLNLLNSIDNVIDNSINDYKYFKSLFTEEKHLEKLSIQELFKLIVDCKENIASIKNKIQFDKLIEEYKRNEHFGNFITYCLNNNLKENLANIYLKRFYSRMIQSYIYDSDYLESTTKTRLLTKIKEFSKLTKEQIRISRVKVTSKWLDEIPVLKKNLASNDERNFLIKEHNKATRKKPLRQLFDNIPSLIMKLKPCLMMSPLTVSNYLENDKYEFDLVIFDEASQIKPEEAIGSIYRGKQVIIAGDSKQLPPTNFFSKQFEFDSDDEDDYFNDDFVDESILELATKKLPSITLLWHYRSKNEDLITFSNRYIYDSDLITIPTVKQSQKDFGIEYEYVEGVYNKKKQIANEIEAKKVVELIKKHIETYGTSRSLGVIAFGERQRYTIDKAILDFRKEQIKIHDSTYNMYEDFFTSETKEPFFVKNIENVQGDERDTIIFSIGYGPDENNIFRYNFGPLQQVGGERRLNVAISRAKYNLKIVCSFYPDDLDLSRIESEGVKLFKKYLEFAYNLSSNRIVYSTDDDNNYGIKRNISNYLNSQGYKTVLDYGNSSFKIDIAVVDKYDENAFVCGILIDGSQSDNGLSCKDREVLKNEVLGDNGWKIYNVFSRYYYENSKKEHEDILNFINSNIHKEDEENQDDSNYFEEVEQQDEVNNYGFETYKEFDYQKYKENTNIFERYFFKLVDDKLIESVLSYVGVMNINDLIDQIAKAFGESEHFVRNKVLNIIKNDKYQIDPSYKQFVYLKNQDINIVRQCKNGQKREIKYIYPNEVMNCILTIIKNNLGLNADGIIEEAMMVFGIKSKVKSTRDFFTLYLNRLLADKKITIIDGKIELANGGDINEQ